MASPRPRLYPRFAAARVAAALRDTPVVLVNGPRQSGKTTLVRELIAGRRDYVTLDDATELAAANADPTGFVRRFDRVAIDEVQRAPGLLRAIKKAVDDDRRPGRFLLTGSANLLSLPRVAESLAGRMEVVTLLPLSRSELRRRRPSFLRDAFSGRVGPAQLRKPLELERAVESGGYPALLARTTDARRRAWAREYLRSVVERDARDAADIEKLDQLPRLLRAMAHNAAQLANFTRLGAAIGLDDKTTRKYVGVLERLYLVQRVAPWSRNRLKRVVKAPKLHFLDSGLLGAISPVSGDRPAFGRALETFVFSELAKQAAILESPPAIHYYRDKDQLEVDFVLEDERGRVVGVEVKAAASVGLSDFRGLRRLSKAVGRGFALGVVFYDGGSTAPFGDRLFAAPISTLF